MNARIPPPLGPVRYGTSLDYAMEAFESSVMELRTVDPVTVEVVRLRCGRMHNCRRCKSVRYAEALDAGFNEEVGAAIDDYENSDLPPHLKAALRLVDTLVLTPRVVDPGLRADLHQHFSSEAIAAICLYVVKFSVQKTLVALQIDEPLSPGISVLRAAAESGPTHARRQP